MAYRIQTKTIMQALEKCNGHVCMAARMIKCDPKTIYLRAKKVKKLRELLEDLGNYSLDIAESELDKATERGEEWAIKYKLSTKGRSRGYGDSKNIILENRQVIVDWNDVINNRTD